MDTSYKSYLEKVAKFDTDCSLLMSRLLKHKSFEEFQIRFSAPQKAFLRSDCRDLDFCGTEPVESFSKVMNNLRLKQKKLQVLDR